MGYFPNVFGAIFIILAGWLTAKIVRGLSTKLLQVVGLVALGEKIKFNEELKKVGFGRSLDQIVGALVYYMVFLVFLVSSVKVLGIKMVLDSLNEFIAYLPHVLGAFLILVIALYIAKVIKEVTTSVFSSLNVAYAGGLSSLIEILIVGFGIVMALTELGVDMTAFTANITVIIAGVVFAIALSIGLGSRSVMSNVLARYYIAQLSHVEDEVVLAGQMGVIVKVTPVSVVIKTEINEQLYIPNDQIIEEGSNVRKYANPPQPLYSPSRMFLGKRVEIGHFLPLLVS